MEEEIRYADCDFCEREMGERKITVLRWETVNINGVLVGSPVLICIYCLRWRRTHGDIC